MKNSILFSCIAAIALLISSCEKEEMPCTTCGGGNTTVCDTTTVTINNTINNTTDSIINGVHHTATTTTYQTIHYYTTSCGDSWSDTTYANGGTTVVNNGNGGNNGNNGTYGTPIVQVITPNATTGNLTVGTSYWGFTSAPGGITSGSGLGSYHGPIVCTPIKITITGYNIDGAYTYTADPFVVPAGITFIRSYDDQTKSAITTAIADVKFVVVGLASYQEIMQ